MAKPAKSGGGAPASKDAATAVVSICQNRRARHDYALTETLEAGVVLQGTEVKACRAGHAHLNEAYVQVVRREAMLIGGYIGEYAQGNRFNHPTDRSRKLLLHRQQIDRLQVALNQKGCTAVPLSLYFRGGRVKLSFGVGTGKRQVDKRHSLKARETQRDMDRALRGRNRRHTLK